MPILVEDVSGCRYAIYRFEVRRLFRRECRFLLDTGEAVQRLDPDNYRHARTGEILVRID